MKNRFSAEYATLPDYIIGITEQIWEGRQIDLIHRYYSPDCWVLSPSGLVTGVEAVITGTKATLAMFPDRELLGEDVIWSNDGQKRGLLSSHRIISPMTHRGDGVFGKATGRTMRIRTIADCLVVGDVITEEWLVRDQGAMALAIGTTPEALGREWAKADAAAGKAPWQHDLWDQVQAGIAEDHAIHHAHPAAVMVRDAMMAAFGGALSEAELARSHDRAVNLMLPNGAIGAGWADLAAFIARFRQAMPDLALMVDHSIALEEPGRPVRVATRWRLAGTHAGSGPWGDASGAQLFVLGITHSEVVAGKVIREFWLVDETAIWRQIALRAG